MSVKTSKRFRSAQAHLEPQKSYPLEDAVGLLDKMPKTQFDETVELAVKLGVDPRQSTQMVRGIVDLPHGSGKQSRVIVFTDTPEPALEAGADHAGLDELIKKVKEGWLDFDLAIATPAAMKEVRTAARVLGPRGLMPNPKSGTVTDDVVEAVKSLKGGSRIEFKMDKTSNAAIVVGKRSFSVDQLIDNINAAIKTLKHVRPQDFKGKYIKNLTLTATMSPGIKLDSALYA